MNENPMQAPPDDKITMKGGFNFLLFMAQVHAACLWPFLRSHAGVEALRVHGGAAFVFMMLVAACGANAIALYACVWVVFAARMRLTADESQHSRYSGFPSVAIRIPGFRTEMKAKAAECLLCLLVGVLLMPLDEALGAFVALGCVSLGLMEGIDREVNRMRLRRMRDAQIEHSMLAERYRGERHDF